MAKIIPLLIIAGLFLSCSVTTEKYRYKLRFDKFYFLLNSDEKGYFASDDLDKLGSSVKLRLASDTNFYSKWRDVQFYEAIATFDPVQTGHFFRETILKELNLDNYYIFMNMLESGTQKEFAYYTNFTVSFNRLCNNNASFKNFIASLKTDYRLYGFSDEQVCSFFRHTLFPEATRKEIVYYLLKELKGCGALPDFKAGNISAASQKLAADMQNNPADARQFETIRKASGLTALSVQELLQVYSDVVMKEMDPYALSHTLAKF
jgi:hypothetical protein